MVSITLLSLYEKIILFSLKPFHEDLEELMSAISYFSVILHAFKILLFQHFLNMEHLEQKINVVKCCMEIT
jgi:uncharacterized protein YhhL (DUF1145 family)